MKILYVTDTYYPHVNGVYYFVRRLASNLLEKGHEVAVIAPSESIRFSYLKQDGINVYGMPSLPVLFYKDLRLPLSPGLKKRLGRIIETYKPDVIHVQNHFALNKAVLEANKKYKIPVVATNHFMTENLTSFFSSLKWRRRISRWLWSDFSRVFNQAAIVTTPTETAACLIRPRLKGKVMVISNGIDLKRFTPETDLDFMRKKYSIPDKPILLCVGRLDPEKHVGEVLRAVAQAVKKIDFCCVIVGKGTQGKALKELSRELEIENDVVFTGFVPEEDLPHIYKCSSCFITASIAELQSIATMEAMASGLPVIAADAGALSELVHDGINGYMFQPGDINTIAASVYNIFSSNSLYRKMKQASLDLIADHDIQRTVHLYEKLYQRYVHVLPISEKLQEVKYE